MSNHVTATQSKIIILRYTDNVKTLVNCQDWRADAIVNAISKRLEDLDECYEWYRCVWYVDNVLNSYGLSQCMLYEGSTILNPEHTIWINHPYDLGENETERDVQKYYPNYRRNENE